MKDEPNSPTSARKDEHLKLCLKEDVGAEKTSYWEEVRIPHCALPDVDYASIQLESPFLGETFAAPLFISSMTGGTPHSDKINERLAVFAQEARLPMGVGSQRVLLEKAGSTSFQLRKVAPRARLFGNIGAVQLNYGVEVDDLRRLVDKIEASGLFLHLNPLQEAIQTEGNRNFAGLWKKMEKLRASLKIPLILKETGCGLDPQTARRAQDIGLDAVDTSGMGGTHWGYIEGLRSPGQRPLGELFRSWGIPAPQALQEVRQAVGPDYPVIASGGLRSGLDIARALYLGADFTAMALPFLRAADAGDMALRDFFTFLVEGLRVALFSSGYLDPKELKKHGKIVRSL